MKATENPPGEKSRGDDRPGRAAASGDPSFIEEVVRELATQNQRDRDREPGAEPAAPAAQAEGAADTARSSEPPSEPTPDLMHARVDDPRRMPTVRLPRRKKEEPTPAPKRDPRAGRAIHHAEAAARQASRARGSIRPGSDDGVPTLRSPADPATGGGRRLLWIGLAVAAVLGVILAVMMAMR